jgi:hypothetical protein
MPFEQKGIEPEKGDFKLFFELEFLSTLFLFLNSEKEKE